MRFIILAAVLVFVNGANNSFAAQFNDRRSTVLINPVSGANGHVKIDDSVRDITAEIGILIGKGEQVAIIVEQVNPVLFSYQALEPSKEPTESFAATSKFAEALEGLVGQLVPVATARAAPANVTIEGLDARAFLQNSANLINRYKQATMLIDGTAAQNNGTYSTSQTTVAGWDGETLLKQIATQFDEARGILGKQLAGQPITYTIEGMLTTTAASIGNISDQVEITDPALAERLRVFPAIVLEKDQFIEMARLLASFESAFLEIGIQKHLATISYDPKYVISQKIVVKPNQQFEVFLSDKAKAFQKQRSTEIVFVGEPRIKIHVSISPGIIYSFVRNPEFSTTEDSSGQIIVGQKENDVVALGGAVALNFVPDRFHGQGIEPFLQIGVTPDSDTPAVFVGVGFKGFESALFSAGAVYQRVNQLGGGLAVGDVLSSVDDLITDDKWESGLYISIGVNFGD